MITLENIRLNKISIMMQKPLKDSVRYVANAMSSVLLAMLLSAKTN